MKNKERTEAAFVKFRNTKDQGGCVSRECFEEIEVVRVVAKVLGTRQEDERLWQLNGHGQRRPFARLPNWELATRINRRFGAQIVDLAGCAVERRCCVQPRTQFIRR